MESPDIDSYMYNQYTFDKGTKKIEWRKDSFSKNCAEIIGHPNAKNNMNLDTVLRPSTKMNKNVLGN